MILRLQWWGSNTSTRGYQVSLRLLVVVVLVGALGAFNAFAAHGPASGSGTRTAHGASTHTTKTKRTGSSGSSGSGTSTGTGTYPAHTGIIATVFWWGEPVGNGSSADNSISTYDSLMRQDFGGYDDPTYRRVAPNYWPTTLTPLENPYYLDLPFDDLNNAAAFAHRCQVVPWASQFPASRCADPTFSYMKNHWVKLWRTDTKGATHTCYGQIEDAGPYVYDDEAYVFGTSNARPQSTQANNAGLDVAPSLRDCLNFDVGSGWADIQNNASNRVNWQFVAASQVPAGPWAILITTQGVRE
jgi:hypothetical protein